MAAIDRLTGKDLVVIFLPTGGVSPTNDITLTADYTSFDWNRQVETVDVTAGNETNRYEKATIQSLDFTLSMFDADQTWLDDVQPGATGKLTVRKEGTGSGKAELAFNCLFTGFSTNNPFSEAIEVELTGVRIGAMVTEIGSTQ